MLFFMIAVAAVAFAEQLPQTDANAQSAQNADNSGQAAVTLVVGDGQGQETPATDQQVVPSNESNQNPDIGTQEVTAEKVPLASGIQPTVTIQASTDLKKLRIDDKLLLKAELSGFDGSNYSLQWQTRIRGEWKDLDGATSDEFKIAITKENADWAYRVVAVTQPA